MSTSIKCSRDGVDYESYSYGEFVSYVNSVNKAPSTSDERSKDSHDSGWFGTEDWDEAMDYAIHGWDAGIKAMQENIKTYGMDMSYTPDIVGHTVDVGRFLSGLPDSMVTFSESINRRKKNIALHANLAYAHYITKKEAMQYSSNLVNLVANLSSTFNVKLVGVFWTSFISSPNNMTVINIKELDEPLIMNNVAFAYHPSFFRRLWFRWLESKDIWQSSYGSKHDKKIEQSKTAVSVLQELSRGQECYFVPEVYDSFDVDEEYKRIVESSNENI